MELTGQCKFHLKEISRSLILKPLSWEPLLRLARERDCKRIAVLMYHGISSDDANIDAWAIARKSDFISQMEYLTRHFDVVSMEEALARMTNREDKNEKKPSVVITFDDGYASYKRILLPILKSMNIPATLFIATQAVQDQALYWYDRLIRAFQKPGIIHLDLRCKSLNTYTINQVRGSRNWNEIRRLLSDLKSLEPGRRMEVVDEIINDIDTSHNNAAPEFAPLSIDDLRELADCPLVTIGAHSHCHNILTQLQKTEIVTSVMTSKNLLELWTNRPVDLFSYPNGNYNDQIITCLKDLGFKCAVSTEPGMWGKEGSIYIVPRIAIGRYDSIERFKILVSGLRLRENDIVKLVSLIFS